MPTPNYVLDGARPPAAERRFHSPAVERRIRTVTARISNPKLAAVFGCCYPNTLDTTVSYSEENGRPLSYVVTGDIDAMWLRDSSAQVFPYVELAREDPALRRMVAGVINRHADFLRRDPYANAFYDDPGRIGPWAADHTDVRPGVHERKYELDSLCYVVRLAYHYWRQTGDGSVFDPDWHAAARLVVQTCREQQRKEGPGPYRFQRTTPVASETLALDGYGYPVKPTGLVCSAFRPSDDATVHPFLVPANLFAVRSLRQLARIVSDQYGDAALAGEALGLAGEISGAVRRHAVATVPGFGRVFAYEVDGFGGRLIMDDANVPSLLSLPLLGAVRRDSPVYRNTRRLVLGEQNPFFFRGAAGEGIGGPHVGLGFIWPLGIIVRALTSTDPAEIVAAVRTLLRTDAGTNFMHESFHQDDPTNYTRGWFAWANSLFGELVCWLADSRPELLDVI